MIETKLAGGIAGILFFLGMWIGYKLGYWDGRTEEKLESLQSDLFRP